MPARTDLIDRSTLTFLPLWGGLLWLRIAGLQLSPLNLHFDEAQYWTWSRHLEWGYFSKPPMVAWAIGAATTLFGNDEWAVRLAAPVSQALAALALFGLGRSMYGPWAGFWAGLGWLLMPGIALSSGIISTDALLLAFWAIALLALWRVIVTRAWIWAIWLGVAVGLGALTKYAMLYFLLSTALAALWSRPAKAALLSGQGALSGIIALAMLAPNLWWNFNHGFATIEHTAANARLSANLFNPGELGGFIASQALLIGPLLFLALIGLFWRGARQAVLLSDNDRTLLAFILPPLVIISVEAFISRANGNWAATAYPAAIVWLAGNLSNTKGGVRFMAVACALNAIIGGVVTLGAVYPSMADAICLPGKHPTCLSNSFKRARGWDQLAREVAQRALAQPGEAPFTAVLVDHRATYFELAYYWRDARRTGAPLPPVRMWLMHAAPHNSAEQLDAMRPEEGARVLVIHANPTYLTVVAGDFTAFRTVDHFSILLGAAPPREYEISVGEGFAPARRDTAFEQRLLEDD